MFNYVNPFKICFQDMPKHSLLHKLYQNLPNFINFSGTLRTLGKFIVREMSNCGKGTSDNFFFSSNFWFSLNLDKNIQIHRILTAGFLWRVYCARDTLALCQTFWWSLLSPVCRFPVPFCWFVFMSWSGTMWSRMVRPATWMIFDSGSSQ